MAGRKVTVFALVKAKPGMAETVKQEFLAAADGTIARIFVVSSRTSGHHV